MNENLRFIDSRTKQVTVTEIQDWLVAHLAHELQVNPSRIRIDQPILSYGIDSMKLVTIIAKLEDWLGLRFSSNPLEDHATIAALSRFVVDCCRDARPTTNDRPSS